MKRATGKTYEQVVKQIAVLEAEAQLLKKKEVPGVIDRIKKAIDEYGLTVDDLFGTKGPRQRRVKASGKATRVPKTGGSAKGKAKRKTVKYRDDGGNTWSGRGPRPAWLKAAIEQGKTLEDLAV